MGKIVSKFRLPSLLGWLLVGMILGPYGFALLSNDLVGSHWYEVILKILECAVGFMIGTELVIKKLKKSGKALVVTTIFQSLGTYFFVSLIFAIVFGIMNIPIYLAFIFGGIALATAPAPALSIVQEFKTAGPVTDTLIPMAALDDVVGVICFFSTIAFVVMGVSGGSMPVYIVPVIIVLPLIIGLITGFPAGKLLKKYRTKGAVLTILLTFILITAFIGLICNKYLLSRPILNFMLMGMSFSAVFSNMVEEEYLEKIIGYFEPILLFSLIIVILNLGVPLNYRAILGAGLFTLIYILSRAIGKYFGARIGAKVTKMPQSVQKYLGFTLLPHSGVSLVFAGIAVSVLNRFDSNLALIIQGTIAAAAIINEIIAVVVAKKAFEWAGEMDKKI
ncbi:cation:proton antiporter [Peptoniphilaceae bacterium SGI.131]